MIAFGEKELISTEEVLARTGISWAILNKYITLNIIPTPTICTLNEPVGPAHPGYFPSWVVERIESIRKLKADGVPTIDVADRYHDEGTMLPGLDTEKNPEMAYRSLQQIFLPAILVNQNWEIIWINQKAKEELFHQLFRVISPAEKRNMFQFFLTSGLMIRFSNWQEILAAHIRIAKADLPRNAIENLAKEEPVCPSEELKQLWPEVEPLTDRPITQQELILKPRGGKPIRQTLVSSEFREGTLLLYAPASMQLDYFVDLLMGRANPIRMLFSDRIPSLTPLCILAGRLESGLHLRTALPPKEYFDLINQVVLRSHQCFKNYGGTPGRSGHESIVGYFLPTVDSERDYFFETLQCAQALQQMISVLNRRWGYNKGWNNELRFNIGIHCGDEWLGTVPSATAFEPTVMGETLTQSTKLSEFAHGGSIWASKTAIESLTPENRQRVEFGIRREAGGRELIASGIYSQVRELLNLEKLESNGLREIGNFAVTEIIEVHQHEDQD